MTNVVADYPDWSTFKPNQLSPTMVIVTSFPSDGHKYLPDLTSGHYYIFGWDVVLDSGGTPSMYTLQDFESEVTIAAAWCNASASINLELGGFTPINSVSLVFDGGGTVKTSVLRYAIGP